MPPIIRDLFLSKKFVVALLTLTGSVTAYVGWNVDTTRILTFVTPLLLYIGAQGWADAGKEKAKIVADASMKQQLEAQQHEKEMAKIKQPALMNSQAGFAKLGVLIVISAMLWFPIALSCAHPGQVVLKTGQCVLDGKVMSTVISNLEKPAYAQLIADLAIAPDLVNCALRAVASQEAPGQDSGSGLPKGTPNLLAARAREVLAFRSAQ